MKESAEVLCIENVAKIWEMLNFPTFSIIVI
jgi:hypothetical protein